MNLKTSAIENRAGFLHFCNIGFEKRLSKIIEPKLSIVGGRELKVISIAQIVFEGVILI